MEAEVPRSGPTAAPGATGAYGRYARFYDPIYHAKEYPREAERVCAILGRYGIARGARVLEAACGTGRYLAELRRWYRVAGFDLSEEMLAIARERAPGVPLFRADMTRFAVREPVDALLCLFSSIGYLHPEPRLEEAARAFAAAVRPGGVLIVEPWIAPEVYTPGRVWMDTYRSDDLCLSRGNVSSRKGDLAILDFHWLAFERDPPRVHRFEERHRLWLCPREQMRAVFERAGFEVELVAEGLMRDRGLFVGRRR